jgi:hypothetical protein
MAENSGHSFILPPLGAPGQFPTLYQLPPFNPEALKPLPPPPPFNLAALKPLPPPPTDQIPLAPPPTVQKPLSLQPPVQIPLAPAPQPSTGIQKGLKLNDSTIVSKISGPVSMHYLKPNEDFYRSFRGQVNFPLVLLFGDVHRSEEQLCEPCNKENRRNMCYEIYNPEFLRQFDNLASQDSPIDFFTESAPKWITNNSFLSTQGILFNKFYKQVVKNCHKTELRKRNYNRYKEICPTENIRWHWVDVRFNTKNVEYYLFNGLDEYIQKNVYQDYPLENFYKFKYSTVGASISHLNRVEREHIESVTNNVIKIHTLIIDEFIKYLINPKQREEIKSNFTKLIGNKILQYITAYQKYSLINKQFSKVHNLFEIIKNYILNSLADLQNKFVLIRLYNVELLNQFKQIILRRTKLIPIAVSDELRRFIQEYCTFFINNIDDKLLDIYCILRMFKNPQNDKNSTLSICYFGDAHINNIRDILMKLFGYNIYYFHPENERNLRCLDIKEFINLPRDIQAHNLLRAEFRGRIAIDAAPSSAQNAAPSSAQNAAPSSKKVKTYIGASREPTLVNVRPYTRNGNVLNNYGHRIYENNNHIYTKRRNTNTNIYNRTPKNQIGGKKGKSKKQKSKSKSKKN